MIYEYDHIGTTVRFTYHNGTKAIRRYDSTGSLIYFKDSNVEETKDYKDGKCYYHYKNIDGFEYWKEYDENNVLLSYKDSNGLTFKL